MEKKAMKYSLFNTKKEYLQFKKVWAIAVKSPRAKKYYEPVKFEITNELVFIKHTGWIKPEHLIFYNIVRGKDSTLGFLLKTKDQKRNYNHALLRLLGYYLSARALTAREAPDYCYDVGVNSGIKIMKIEYILKYRRHIQEFTEPFGTLVTMSMLSQLDKSALEARVK
jgi:hypothetical protein